MSNECPKDDLYFLPIDITLEKGGVKNISVNDQLIIDPILKKINGRWTSAIFDVEVTYNENMKKVRLENKSGCEEPLEIRLRTIHVKKIQSL